METNPLPIESGFEKVLDIGDIAFDGLKLNVERSLEIIVVDTAGGLRCLRKARAVVQKNVLEVHESGFVHDPPHAT